MVFNVPASVQWSGWAQETHAEGARRLTFQVFFASAGPRSRVRSEGLPTCYRFRHSVRAMRLKIVTTRFGVVDTWIFLKLQELEAIIIKFVSLQKMWSLSRSVSVRSGSASACLFPSFDSPTESKVIDGVQYANVCSI